jgi:hypothetical protein
MTVGKAPSAGAGHRGDDPELAPVLDHVGECVGAVGRGDEALPVEAALERGMTVGHRRRRVDDDPVVDLAQHVVGDPRRPEREQSARLPQPFAPRKPALTHCMTTMRSKIGAMSSRKLTPLAVRLLTSTVSQPRRDESKAVISPVAIAGP